MSPSSRHHRRGTSVVEPSPPSRHHYRSTRFIETSPSTNTAALDEHRPRRTPPSSTAPSSTAPLSSRRPLIESAAAIAPHHRRRNAAPSVGEHDQRRAHHHRDATVVEASFLRWLRITVVETPRPRRRARPSSRPSPASRHHHHRDTTAPMARRRHHRDTAAPMARHHDDDDAAPMTWRHRRRGTAGGGSMPSILPSTVARASSRRPRPKDPTPVTAPTTRVYVPVRRVGCRSGASDGRVSPRYVTLGHCGHLHVG